MSHPIIFVVIVGSTCTYISFILSRHYHCIEVTILTRLWNCLSFFLQSLFIIAASPFPSLKHHHQTFLHVSIWAVSQRRIYVSSGSSSYCVCVRAFFFFHSKRAGAVNDGRWHHVCFTWESTAGSYNIYVDGSQKTAGSGLKKGHVIRGGGALILGQEQDSVGGGFDASQSFVGMMSQVNLWNRVLTAQEISHMSQSCRSEEGNVLKWSDFKHGIRGAVQIIEPSPCSP